MNIKPIKTNSDYKNILKRIEELWEAKPGTEKGDELEILSILVEKYENEKFNILPPNPVEAIKFRMEQLGIGNQELAKLIGANRASEILRGKRGLTLRMIRNLHASWQIPTDSLVG